MTEVLAIVPARGGSKGVPGKNLARVGGRSLVARAVDAARESRGCTRILLSTDAREIADEGVRAGAEVPFLRPPELARDDTPGIAPVLHAIRWLAEHEGYRPEWVVLLQPTSPLRVAADVDGALELALRTGADAVVGITESPVHPFWTRSLDEAGRLVPFLAAQAPTTRRQELPPVYVLNGAVYVARRSVIEAQGTMSPEGTLGYVMPRERSLDVDSSWDLRVADMVLGRERGG